MTSRSILQGVLAGSATLLLSGCSTLLGPNDMQYQQQAEIDRLKSEVRRLQGQVDGILETQDRLFTDVNTIRTAQDKTRSELEGGIQEIRSTVESESTARESMRGEIISHIGERVTRLLDRQADQTPPARSERGYEHVVKTGQTLSEIAAVYGAKVDEIVAANKLSSPDKIRVGQKLFIPARGGAR